jgi:formylglycine-generating enzyme required for sulfatase activity
MNIGFTIAMALMICLSVHRPAYAAEDIIVDGRRVEEAKVEGGSYYVGHVLGRQDYKKHANTKVNGFYIMKTEVPYSLYQSVRNWGSRHGYKLEDACNGSVDEVCGADEADGGRHPVVSVSWWGAIAFANALSAMAALKPVYRDRSGKEIASAPSAQDASVLDVQENSAADGFRLPSYAEWHIAARGAQAALAQGSYGLPVSGSARAGEVAWHEKNAGRKTHPVGLKRPNQLGVYDMSGNVSEWTGSAEDLYGGFGGQNSEQKKGSYKMMYYCGDSVLLNQDASFSCDAHTPGYRGPDIGFRLVRRAV